MQNGLKQVCFNRRVCREFVVLMDTIICGATLNADLGNWVICFSSHGPKTSALCYTRLSTLEPQKCKLSVFICVYIVIYIFVWVLCFSKRLSKPLNRSSGSRSI